MSDVTDGGKGHAKTKQSLDCATAARASLSLWQAQATQTGQQTDGQDVFTGDWL